MPIKQHNSSSSAYHLLTHSRLPSPLLPAYVTPIPTSPTIITTLELYIYISQKFKITHQPSTLTSPSSITHCSLLSPSPMPNPRPLTTLLHPTSLVLTDGTNTSISLPLHLYRTYRSHLVFVASEFQAQAILTLKGLEGKPFLVSPDTQLNTYTVLIFHKICPVGVSLSDCSSDLPLHFQDHYRCGEASGTEIAK